MKISKRKSGSRRLYDLLNEASFVLSLEVLIAGSVIIASSYDIPTYFYKINSDNSYGSAVDIYFFVLGFLLFLAGILGLAHAIHKYDPIAKGKIVDIGHGDYSNSATLKRLGTRHKNALFIITGPVMVVLGDYLLPKGLLFYFPAVILMMVGLGLFIFGVLAIISGIMLQTS